jgi:hypothetical protein
MNLRKHVISTLLSFATKLVHMAHESESTHVVESRERERETHTHTHTHTQTSPGLIYILI